MINADYTAKDRVGTLTISTDERQVAYWLREAYFQIKGAVEDGVPFSLIVERED